MSRTSLGLVPVSAPRNAALRARRFLTAAILRGAVCAGLALAAAAATTPATAQQTDPDAVELSPVVMDRWLVVQKEIVARRKADLAAGKAEQSDEEAQAFFDEICGKAGFASTDECSDTIGYVGMLVTGYDPRTRRYGDPAAAAQRRIAEIEANTKMSQAAKDEALAVSREGLEMLRQVLPNPVPEAHLELMNAYHGRIVEANR